jgi:hypothetical protein
MPRDFRSSQRVWSNPKIVSIFLLVFLCGGTLGAVFTRVFLHTRMSPVHASSVTGLEELKQKLNLTPDQARVVAQELDDYAKYYQNIEEEREDVAEHGRGRILAVLTPEQRKIFIGLFKKETLPVNGIPK